VFESHMAKGGGKKRRGGTSTKQPIAGRLYAGRWQKRGGKGGKWGHTCGCGIKKANAGMGGLAIGENKKKQVDVQGQKKEGLEKRTG